MADQFSRLYDVERVGGDQRTRLAEMLRAAGQNQPQGQMVSGWYVPPSWSQNLNTVMQGALGTYMGAQLDEERKAKTAEILRQLSQGKEVEPIPAVQNFNGMQSMAEGQTPMPQQAPQNELERITQRRTSTEMSQPSQAMMPQQQQRYVPLTEEEKIGKVMELAQYNPYAAQIWSTQDAARQARLSKAEERAMDREFKRELQQEQLQGRMDLARMTAGIAAANRPERMLTVMDESGTPFTIPQSQMQPGMTIYTPATAKAFQERKTKQEAEKSLGGTLDYIEQQYRDLNKGEGIPSQENRWGTNLGAKIAGTGIGQWVGQAATTKNQEARDNIAKSIPLLLADIKKKTGMTASEMNSEGELQMWLRSATDPRTSYESNMSQLKFLREKYGLDGGTPKPTGGMPDMSAIDAEIAARKQRSQGR